MTAKKATRKSNKVPMFQYTCSVLIGVEVHLNELANSTGQSRSAIMRDLISSGVKRYREIESEKSKAAAMQFLSLSDEFESRNVPSNMSKKRNQLNVYVDKAVYEEVKKLEAETIKTAKPNRFSGLLIEALLQEQGKL